MSQKIPGGRQRASSEGDILEGDEEGDVIESNQPLNESHRQVSRSIHLTGDSHLQTFDDEDRRSDRSIGPSERKKKSRKLSFKSVRNLMGRVIRNASSSSSVKDQDLNSRATWTPTMKRKNDATMDKKTSHNEWRSEREMPGSTSRPLITDPYHVPRCRWEKPPGIVGLHNHGNTCFMNAVLQCLSNTDSFTEYFVTDMHTKDLRNSRNANKKGLGRGEVTDQLGVLLKSLWSNKYSTEVSSNFKSAVGKSNSQYKGSSQHDAQEFLLWLLDRIHEDLASSSKKKAKPLKNAHLAGDEELAAEAEASGSSSFVTELFQALHRSSLKCPHCGRHSNTFDPYLCVSLPLPQRCPRPVVVTLVITGERNRAIRIGLRLNTYDTVRDLRGNLSSTTGIPETQLILCHIAEDGERTLYSDDQPLSDIPESQCVFALETFPPEPPSSQESYLQLAIVHTEREHNPSRSHWFCSPALVRVPREVSCRQLQREVLASLGDAVKEGARLEINRLNLLFRLRVVDGTQERIYLPNNVEMPLFTEAIDRALSLSEGGLTGPPHILLIAEWETQTKKTIIEDDLCHVEDHRSVQEVKQPPDSQLSVSLQECLQLYTQDETLGGDDAWLCPHCKHQQQGASKTLGLWSLPDVLVIHLKRFKQVGLRRNKLNTLVEFPVEGLDMSPHLVPRASSDIQQAPLTTSADSGMGSSLSGSKLLNGSNGNAHPAPSSSNYSKDDVTYDLYAVANHYGNMMGGHYTAYCKSPVNGKWSEFDDTRVKKLDEGKVATNAAYLLFYQRRSLTKFCNQNLFTGTHWVFRIAPPKVTSPVTSDPSPPSQPVSRSHSPQRPLRAPLTPQPPRRQNLVTKVVEYYEPLPSDPRGHRAESPERLDRPALRKQSSEPTYQPQRNVEPPQQPHRSSEPVYKPLQNQELPPKRQQSMRRPENPVSVMAVLPQNLDSSPPSGVTLEPQWLGPGVDTNAVMANSGVQGPMTLPPQPPRPGTFVAAPSVNSNLITSDLERSLRPTSEVKVYEHERTVRPLVEVERESGVRDRQIREDGAGDSGGTKMPAVQKEGSDFIDARPGHVENKIRAFEKRIDAADEQKDFERLKDQYRKSFRPERPPKLTEDFGTMTGRRLDRVERADRVDRMNAVMDDLGMTSRRPDVVVNQRIMPLEDQMERYCRMVDPVDVRGMPSLPTQNHVDFSRGGDRRGMAWQSRDSNHSNGHGARDVYVEDRPRDREGHERFVDLTWHETGFREADRHGRPVTAMEIGQGSYDPMLQHAYRVELPPPREPVGVSMDSRPPLSNKYATIARGNRGGAFMDRRGSGGGLVPSTSSHENGNGMPRSMTDYTLNHQTMSRLSRNEQPRMSERHHHHHLPSYDRDTVSITSTHSRSRPPDHRDSQPPKTHLQPSYIDRQSAPTTSYFQGFSRYPRAHLSRTHSQSQASRKLEVSAPVLKESSV